jgi:hypothetical protein
MARSTLAREVSLKLESITRPVDSASGRSLYGAADPTNGYGTNRYHVRHAAARSRAHNRTSNARRLGITRDLTLAHRETQARSNT